MTSYKSKSKIGSLTKKRNKMAKRFCQTSQDILVEILKYTVTEDYMVQELKERLTMCEEPEIKHTWEYKGFNAKDVEARWNLLSFVYLDGDEELINFMENFIQQQTGSLADFYHVVIGFNKMFKYHSSPYLLDRHDMFTDSEDESDSVESDSIKSEDESDSDTVELV
jgi:hypothetical protein